MAVQKKLAVMRACVHTHIHTCQSVLLFPNSFISYATDFRLDGTVDRLPPPKPKAEKCLLVIYCRLLILE